MANEYEVAGRDKTGDRSNLIYQTVSARSPQDAAEKARSQDKRFEVIDVKKVKSLDAPSDDYSTPDVGWLL